MTDRHEEFNALINRVHALENQLEKTVDLANVMRDIAECQTQALLDVNGMIAKRFFGTPGAHIDPVIHDIVSTITTTLTKAHEIAGLKP